MTNDQFTEWLESQITKLNEEKDKLRFDDNYWHHMLDGQIVQLELAIEKYRSLPTWIPVTNPDDIFNLGVTYHFLVPVHDSRTDKTTWDIITGYIDESGDLYNQCDGDYAGWAYTDVVYYAHVMELPPLPAPTIK